MAKDDERRRFDGPHQGVPAPHFAVARERSLLVEIHIPDADPSTELHSLNEIRAATAEYLRLFDFVPDPGRQPSELFASWHWKQWFKKLGPEAKEEAKEIYEELKEALRREHIDGAGAAAFEKRANAASTLIASLADYENAIVRLGDVVVAKATTDGDTRLVVETISPKMARDLQNDPLLIKDPQRFINFVDSRQALPEVDE